MSLNSYSLGGAEVLDEQDYQLWLRDPSAPCVHLIELDYGGSYLPPMLSDPFPTQYTAMLSDAPYPPYRDVVASIPSFSQQIGENFSGQVSASIGDLVLHNIGGELDSWLNLNVSGRGVRVYHGHPGWPVARFRRVLTGIAEIVAGADDAAITNRLRGVDQLSNESLHETLIASGANANDVVPMAFGAIFNGSPKKCDAATSTYQVHDGQIQSVTNVRDSGVPFQTAPATIASVAAATDTLTFSGSTGFLVDTRVVFSAGTPPAPLVPGTNYWVIAEGLTTVTAKLSATRGGAAIDIVGADAGAVCTGYHWTADLTAGTILLDSKPAGQLTADFSGHASGGFVDQAADLIPLVLGASQIDRDSQAAFRSICPQSLGIYLPERRNRLDVVADIARGIGAWYGSSHMGDLIMGRVDTNPFSRMTITADMMIADLQLERMLQPRYKHRVKYARNWTVQKTGLAGSVSEENVARYGAEASIPAWTLYADPSVSAPYTVRLAEVQDAMDSMMVTESDAITESLRLDALYYGYSGIFTCTVGRVGTALEIGSGITVQHARYGFSGGRRATLIGIDANHTEGTVALRFWAALGTYVPGGQI